MQPCIVRMCRKIQVGKDFRKSLVQSLAQSRLNYEVSNQVAQGFIHSHLENIWGWRWHNLSGQPAPLPDCPRGEDDLPYIQSGPLVSNNASSLLSSLHVPLWRDRLCLPDTWLPPPGTGRLLLGPPQSCLLCRLNKPDSLSLSPLGECPCPQPSRWLSAELDAVYQCLSCIEKPKRYYHKENRKWDYALPVPCLCWIMFLPSYSLLMQGINCSFFFKLSLV